MICDACRKEIEDKFEILLDKNVAGIVICSVCLENDQPTYIEDQTEWLRSIKNKTNVVLERHSESFKRLHDE